MSLGQRSRTLGRLQDTCRLSLLSLPPCLVFLLSTFPQLWDQTRPGLPAGSGFQLCGCPQGWSREASGPCAVPLQTLGKEVVDKRRQQYDILPLAPLHLEMTPLENAVVGWVMPTGPCSGTTWAPKESRWPAPNKHLCLLLPCEWLHKVQQPGHYLRRVTCAPVGCRVHLSMTVSQRGVGGKPGVL